MVLVSDSVKALQDIAKYKRELYDIPVVGITGSTGKTSVKDMIYKILSKNIRYWRRKEILIMRLVFL